MTPTPAGLAITGLAVRQVGRGALVATALTAGMTVLMAATYERTVAQAPQGASLTVLAGNPAIRTLFGDPVGLEHAGGFTVWRTGTVVSVLLAVWGALAVTRITRGAEDAGHWDLLLAGRLVPTRVIVVHLGVVAAAMVIAGAAIGAALVVAGTDPRGAFLHGAGMALVGVFFVGVSGVTAQVFTSRSSATGAAVAMLAGALLLRMVADGVPALRRLRWVTPFGLVEQAAPYHSDRVVPLMVLGAAAAGLLVAAPALAGRRDVRGGLLAASTARPPRLGLLGSVTAFVVRLSVRPLTGWAAGIGAYFMLIGLVAVSMTGFLTGNPRFADLAAQAGFAGLGRVQGYVAALFAMLSIPVGGFVAARFTAAARDESGGRMTLLYAGPVARRTVLLAETGVTAGGCVVLALVAAVAAWAGVTWAGGDLAIGAAVAGAFNVLPIAALCLGTSAMALGFAPRAVPVLGLLPAIGGFLLLMLGQSVGAPQWVLAVSPYRHLAAVPDAAPDWPATIGMLAAAGALILVGLLAYHHRDLDA